MKNYKCGFVAIVGATNVGKSSLFNVLIDLDISVVNFRAETTQKPIQGVLTTDNFQAVFVDTPGFSTQKNQLHNLMFLSAKNSLIKADVILFLTTPDDMLIEVDILNYISKLKKPKVLAINKIDDYPDDLVAKKQSYLLKNFNFDANFLISTKENKNIKQLVTQVSLFLPISNAPLFDADTITNATMREIVAEFVRASVLKYCFNEIPYGVAVQVEEYKKTNKLTEILVYIYVDKKSATAILVGQEGKMIKKIGTKARLRIEKFIGGKVFLNLKVKLLKKWYTDLNQLKKLGF